MATNKARKGSRKSSTVDYAEAEALAQAAGKEYRRLADEGAKNTLQCSQAVAVALRTGFIHTGEGKAPEGTHTRRSYAQKFFGVADGSLVTLWITGAHLLKIGVKPESVEWQVAMTGARIARRSGVRQALESARNITGVRKVIRDAGIDPRTGNKITGKRVARPNMGTDKGTDKGDPKKESANAVQVLRKMLPKVSPEEYLALRKALTDVLASQDKARKVGPFAPAKEQATRTVKNADGETLKVSAA